MKSKFKKRTKYKSLCVIDSPNGLIRERTILTGKEWIDILVYDVGQSFKQIFKIVSIK